MSRPLISRSLDLQRLRNEGYDVSIRGGYLLLSHIPYVNSRREVVFGTLVSELSLAGNVTTRPQDHQTHLVGEQPCHKDGTPMTRITSSVGTRDLGNGIVIAVSFSSKPSSGYENYYDKMTTYAHLIGSPAQALDPSATAKTGRALPSDGDEDSVFNYIDTASSRAGIGAVSEKLRGRRIGIVGVGGTGSYVLDLVAKTPVDEIHLFDGDTYLQHNAFRSPGAPSLEDLAALPNKAAYFATQYSRMHKRITPHPYRIEAENVAELGFLDFVFVCIDKGRSKQAIVEYLERQNAMFVDVGMGVELTDDGLVGILRVTTSAPEKRDHFRQRVGFTDAVGENDYDRNIQIADLNCLNAALAVVRWKKACGFYHDAEREHTSTYTIDVNMLLSEDRLS